MRFVDLFAGLGGFHIALKKLGHKCVFACETDQKLASLYERNFGLRPSGDIRRVEIPSIPRHDIMCAGFPCQPFSKAGSQDGLHCPRWGDLPNQILKIAKIHQPKYLILENVPNLVRQDEGKTFESLVRRLRRMGYDVSSEILSPHQFGIPQIRDRIFIVASLKGLNGFEWPSPNGNSKQLSLARILRNHSAETRVIPKKVRECLSVWQKFIKQFPKAIELPSFPLWAMEFGATYPFEEGTPFAMDSRKLKDYRGSFGRSLRNMKDAEIMENLPPYARERKMTFPDWKIHFIRQNRELFSHNRKWIKKWLPLIRRFPPSWQKFEWNCKGEHRDIWIYVIQFRASGVRVKRPTTAPSLIAMTTTQVPIIGWEKRYMTTRECAKIQGLQSLRYLPDADTRAYKALGNAVSADLVKYIAQELF